MDDNVVVDVVEEIAKKTFLQKSGGLIWRIIWFIISFKWLWLLSKRSWLKIYRKKDLTIVEILSLIWLIIRLLIFGIIIGIILEKYIGITSHILEWLDIIRNVFIN